MTSKWEPVAQLLSHMIDDDDLMLEWGLVWAGDVRSETGRAALVNMKRTELQALLTAVRARERPSRVESTGALRQQATA